jgi:hypothetical protein
VKDFVGELVPVIRIGRKMLREKVANSLNGTNERFGRGPCAKVFTQFSGDLVPKRLAAFFMNARVAYDRE